MTSRDLPRSILIALAMKLAVLVCRTAVLWTEPSTAETLMRIYIADESLDIAATVVLAAGLFELAQRLTGGARYGALIALAGAVLQLAVTVAWIPLLDWAGDTDHDAVRLALRYAVFGGGVVPILGLALAAWSRARAVAVVALALGLIATLPPVLMDPLSRALTHGFRGELVVWYATQALRLASLLLLASAAAPSELPVEAQLAERGFRRAARALRLRVLAVALVPGLPLLVVAGAVRDAGSAMKLAIVSAAALQVTSLTLLGLGALGAARARLADLRALPLYTSALGSLAFAGYTAVQLPRLYNAMFGVAGFGSNPELDAEQVQIWAITAPLVALGALWCLTGAITGFARRRGLHDLRFDASGRGPIACLLLFAAFADLQWLAPGAAERPDVFAAFLLLGLAGSILGTLMLARLCAQAADALRGTALPTARVT